MNLILRLLRSYSTVLHAAAYMGQLEVIKYLIEERGIEPNVRSKSGQSAYDVARDKRFKESEEYLLKFLPPGWRSYNIAI